MEIPSHILEKGFTTLDQLKTFNQLKSENEYKNMKAGIIPPSKNFTLSQDIPKTRQMFIDEGYEEIDDPNIMFDPNLAGKKARYILKDGKVRMGGRITTIDENQESGLRFIYFRPFVPTPAFSRGWTVQIHNIKYLYIADVRRKNKKRAVDDPQIINFIREVIDNNPELTNKTKTYKFIKKIEGNFLSTLTNRIHINNYFEKINI